jgi:hypothetical protein
MSIASKIYDELGGEGHSRQFDAETRYIIDATRTSNVYCETGFNVGHSAETVLSNNPDVIVHSFDIGGENSLRAYEQLSARYPDRLFVTWGDSTKTLPSLQPLNCDVFFVDGGHTEEVARADLINMEKHLVADGAVIMDDVYCTSEWCTGPDVAWGEALLRNVDEVYRFSSEDKTRGFAAGRIRYTETPSYTTQQMLACILVFILLGIAIRLCGISQWR